MRVTAFFAAAALLATSAVPVLACSGYAPQQLVQSPMPVEPKETAQTPIPPAALTTPTETAQTDAAGTAQAPVKAN